jgi:hypothetical protein
LHFKESNQINLVEPTSNSSVVNLRMEEKSFIKKSQNRYSKAGGLI